MPTRSAIATARLQIELSEEKLRQLDQLMSDTGFATKKELVNNALTLLNWAVRETKLGRIIVSLDEQSKQYKEILLPALENVIAKMASARI